MANVLPIPGPRGLPFLGNFMDVDPERTVQSWLKLAETHGKHPLTGRLFLSLTDVTGEIFKLRLGGNHDQIFITTYELMNEICNEQRFDKSLSLPLKESRNGFGDGLFTAYTLEHNWGVAHRTLQAAFGPLSVGAMFEQMHDVASQLVLKWARTGSNGQIHPTEDFIRMTLDTIALCSMGVRWNSFYTDALHPFVAGMGVMLGESASRASRPSFMTYLLRGRQKVYDTSIAYCRRLAKEAIVHRRENPTDKKDLLNSIIFSKDPKTGSTMTEESMIDNLITFFAAGHETTAGTLSFLMYYFIQEPSVLQLAQVEVDRVVGRGSITLHHLGKLLYLSATMKEVLRVMPTTPSLSFEMRSDSPETHTYIGGGKYHIAKGQSVTALLPLIHKDKAVWGDDADTFNPEHMMEDAYSKIPANAWKPFGNGKRGCIGRPFAWQEALLATAMILQNFNLSFDDPSYKLAISETLTFKPDNLIIRASLRDGIDLMGLERSLHGASDHATKVTSQTTKMSPTIWQGLRKPMTILYGSNAGTCESLAQSLARAAGARGYDASTRTLNSAVKNLPVREPVLIISSSYEGKPPDNAIDFVLWLAALSSGESLTGVDYSVFGCGNHEWASTFHKVPKDIEVLLEANGATQLAPIGFGNVGSGEIFNEFDQWQDEVLWPSLIPNHGIVVNEDVLSMDIDTTHRGTTLKHEGKEATVLSNQLLTVDCEAEKRHISLNLPVGMTYSAGDYLAVLPHNSTKNVRRVLNRFALAWDATLTFHKGSNTTLPTGRMMSVMDVLGAFVELSQPATKKNIHTIASTIANDSERQQVLQLAGPIFNTESRYASPLDILESYPYATLSLASFLQMLPPMRVRQYSISSSPLANPTMASITWSVLDTPSTFKDKSGKPKRFLGVASNYLSSVEVGDCVQVSVKPSQGAFHLPADMEKTPMIMICASSGFAPFRGLIQERAIMQERGTKLAAAYIFIGCMHPEQDVLFASEVDKWEKDGVITVFHAFSRLKEQSKGAKYVHERLWEERKEMVDIFNQGAKIFICGSALVGEGVARTVKKIYAEAVEDLGKYKTKEQVDEWFESIKRERYASDVFA